MPQVHDLRVQIGAVRGQDLFAEVSFDLVFHPQEAWQHRRYGLKIELADLQAPAAPGLPMGHPQGAPMLAAAQVMGPHGPMARPLPPQRPPVAPPNGLPAAGLTHEGWVVEETFAADGARVRHYRRRLPLGRPTPDARPHGPAAPHPWAGEYDLPLELLVHLTPELRLSQGANRLLQVLGHHPETHGQLTLLDLVTPETRSTLLMALAQAAGSEQPAFPIELLGSLGQRIPAHARLRVQTHRNQLQEYQLWLEPASGRAFQSHAHPNGHSNGHSNGNGASAYAPGNGQHAAAVEALRTAAAPLQTNGAPAKHDVQKLQEQLAQAERTIQSLVGTAPVGICVTTEEGNFESVNATYCQIYGYTEEELLGKHFSLVVPKDKKDQWVRAHDLFIAGRGDVRGEFQVVTKRGKRLTILADSARITGQDGRLRKVTFVLDITERKRAEEALHSSEARLRSMFDTAPVGICVTNAEGLFETVNETYCHIYGYTQEELMGQHFTMVVPKDQHAKWRKAHELFIEGKADTRGEFQVHTKAGKRLTILSDSARIVDADGSVKKITYVLDITERKRAEQMLRLSEDRLNTMVETAPVGICVTNAEGLFETVNDAYTHIYGYTREELIGRHFSVVVPKEQQQQWIVAHDKFIAGRGDVRGEFRVVTKSGKQLTILADSARITDTDGNTKKVTYVLDITERKLAEEALRTNEEEMRQNLEEMIATQEQLQRSQERNRLLIETAPVGICVTNEAGEFEAVNDTYCAIYGYHKEDLIGKPFTMVVPPSHHAKWMEAHNKFIAGKNDVRGEFNVVTRAGKQLTILADSARITDADGRVKKITYVLDITERKRSERLLTLSEERLNHMVQAAPVGICVTNAEGNFESVNDSYLSIYGFTREELIGQSFTLVVPKDQKERWLQSHHRFIQGEGHVRGEFNVLTKDGKQLTILADSARITDNDGNVKKVTYVLDITERKRAESLLRLSEERNRKLIEAAPIGICVTNSEGMLEAVNATYCDIYEYLEDELVGQHFTKVVPVEQRDRWVEAHDRFIAGIADTRGEFKVQTKSGRILTVLADSSRITGADGRTRKVTYVLDITARKAAEEKLREQEALLRRNVDELRAAQTEMEQAQGALKLSEALNRSMIESAPVGVCVTNEAGVLETVNATYCMIYGYSEHELVGQPFTLVVPAADKKKWDEAHEKFMAGKADTRGEFTVLAKDGRQLTILADSVRITGLDGSAKKVTFVLDITARKESEAEIRKLSLVASRTDNGIFVANHKGEVEYVNEGFRRMTGVETRDAVGKPMAQMLIAAGADPSEAAEAARNALGKQRVQQQLSLPQADGSTRTISLALTPVIKDGGALEQIVAIASDVTELHDRELALQSALKEVQVAQDQLLVSEKMAALGQLIAGVAHEVNTPISAVKASVSNMIRMLPETIAELPGLLSRIPKNLLPLFKDLVATSVTNDRVLTTKEERNYRRQITQLLEDAGIESAEDLADNLVDIRVVDDVDRFIPLLQSKNSIEVLDMAYKLGQLKVNMTNIDVASDKTAKVVAALKNYSHVQSTDRLVPTLLGDSLDTIVTLYNNQLKYGFEVVKEYEYTQPVNVYPDEIGQVWTNIIQNAIQAMKGSGKLTLRVTEADGMACVSIIDNGPGIPPEIMQRIFEPFFTTKPQGEGTGLGLDITRKIIEKHRGRIDVKSQPGETIFYVYLPVDLQDK